MERCLSPGMLFSTHWEYHVMSVMSILNDCYAEYGSQFTT